MTNGIISAPQKLQFTRSSGQRVRFTMLAFAATLILTAFPGHAGNLLVNPSFEADNAKTRAVPIGWKYFLPPTNSFSIPPGGTNHYWIENLVPAHSGTYFWKEWGAAYDTAPTNNVAGIYQTFSSVPGSTYQASGWFYTSSGDQMGQNSYVWIEVAFLGSSSNLLALYKSDQFSASVGPDGWFQYQVTNACNVASPVSTG